MKYILYIASLGISFDSENWKCTRNFKIACIRRWCKYFDFSYIKSMEWYHDYFCMDARALIVKASLKKPHYVCGEASIISNLLILFGWEWWFLAIRVMFFVWKLPKISISQNYSKSAFVLWSLTITISITGLSSSYYYWYYCYYYCYYHSSCCT